MYRLMLYYLIFLVAVASILSFIGLLSYNGLDILGSAVYLSFICWLANKILAKIDLAPLTIFLASFMLLTFLKFFMTILGEV